MGLPQIMPELGNCLTTSARSFRKGCAVLVLCFGALAMNVAGQYRIDTWTADNGLPQNSIIGIEQTRDGYLWLSTQDGLARFDGVRFKVFNRTNTPAMFTNRLGAMFADQSGRLWIKTENEGLLLYENGLFTAVIKPEMKKFAVIGKLLDDGQGGVLFWNGKEQCHYQEGNFAPFSAPGLPPDKEIIHRDREGWFWWSDRVNIYRVNGEQTQTFPIHGQKVTQTVYQDRYGNYWLNSHDEALDESKVFRLKNNHLQHWRMPARRIWQFTEDKDGNLWMSTFDDGLVRIEAEAVNADEIRPTDVRRFDETGGLLSNKGGGRIYADREGGVWSGTDKGLHRFLPQPVRVFSKKDGLEEDNVYPVLADRKGNVLFGAWVTSLIKWDGKGFSTYFNDVAMPYISSLFEDRDGRLWAGNTGGVYFFANDRPVEFTPQTGLPPAEFNVIAQSPDGALWFGTSKGLARFADNRAQTFTTRDGLPDDNVTSFLQTKDGQIWVGTRGGVATLAVRERGSGRGGEGESYAAEAAGPESARQISPAPPLPYSPTPAFRALTEADGLASNYTRALYEDAEGIIWIGSYDGGLTRLKDGQLTRYTMKEGLHSNGVFCILEEDGWFWINSNQGIYRVRRQDLNDFAAGRAKFVTSVAYGKEDGLLNIEGNGGRQPAAARTADGKLWFPTAQGIAVVDLKMVKQNNVPPPVWVEEVLVDREEADLNGASLQLQPGQNDVEIRYTGISLTQPKSVKFRYRLEGWDNDWVDAGTRRTAYYTHLSPGDYTFRVMAANRDGLWSEEKVVLLVRMQAAIYQTWWFRLLAALGVAGLFYAAYRYRLAQLEREAGLRREFTRQLIASQEAERKRIAAELHDSIGQSLLIIKNRAYLGSLATDLAQAQSQFAEIGETAGEAVEEARDISHSLRPTQLERLGLTVSLQEMVNRIAATAETEFVAEIDPLDGAFTPEGEINFYRIVQEGLNNIIKHSAATRADLTVTRQGSHITLTLADNGLGFALQEGSGEQRRRRNFGLTGIAERIRLLNGTYTLDSAPEQGTTLRVNFILPENNNGN